MKNRNILIISILFALILISSSVFFLLSHPVKNKVGISQNVILIGWDGVQRNHLVDLFTNDELPNLKVLREEGSIIFTGITTGATDTKAGWSEILTGYSAEITGVYSNNKFSPIPIGYTIFERLENYFGDENIATIFITGKGKNLGQPHQYTHENFDVYEVNMGSADEVGTRARQLLEEYQDKRFFAFFHFNEPDYLGHISGENSQEYDQGILTDDLWLGKIMEKLKSLGLYEKTTIYVTTDHGFNEGEKHHNYDPDTFLATNDPAVVRDGDRKDVAPTILEKFGLEVNIFDPKIQGRSLTQCEINEYCAK